MIHLALSLLIPRTIRENANSAFSVVHPRFAHDSHGALMPVWFYSALKTKVVPSSWGGSFSCSIRTKTDRLWCSGKTTPAGRVNRFGARCNSHQACCAFG